MFCNTDSYCASCSNVVMFFHSRCLVTKLYWLNMHILSQFTSSVISSYKNEMTCSLDFFFLYASFISLKRANTPMIGLFNTVVKASICVCILPARTSTLSNMPVFNTPREFHFKSIFLYAWSNTCVTCATK